MGFGQILLMGSCQPFGEALLETRREAGISEEPQRLMERIGRTGHRMCLVTGWDVTEGVVVPDLCLIDAAGSSWINSLS